MFTLITVNYNCAQRTLLLLLSLERQTAKQFSVIVVDNDSTADDRALLGAYAPSSPLALDIIYSDHNRGFAGGNNLAIRKALAQGAVWTLLINPDTEVGPEFIAQLQPQLQSAPAIVGLPMDEGGKVAYAGIVHWLRPTLPHLYDRKLTTIHGKLLYPRVGCLVRLDIRDGKFLYPIGGGMLVHRDVWGKLGLMDERYFLYFEDADFSMRARTGGVPIEFLKEPIIRHAVSASTRALGSPLLLRYHMRNALLFNREHGPLPARISLHFWAFFTMLKQITKIATMPARRAHSRAILAGITDFYAGNFGNIHQTNRD